MVIVFRQFKETLSDLKGTLSSTVASLAISTILEITPRLCAPPRIRIEFELYHSMHLVICLSSEKKNRAVYVHLRQLLSFPSSSTTPPPSNTTTIFTVKDPSLYFQVHDIMFEFLPNSVQVFLFTRK